MPLQKIDFDYREPEPFGVYIYTYDLVKGLIE